MMYDSVLSFNSFSLLTFFLEIIAFFSTCHHSNHQFQFVLGLLNSAVILLTNGTAEEQTLLLWLVQCLAGKQAEGELITQTYNSSLSHLQQARHHGKYLNMMIKKTETGKKKSSMVLWRAARPTAANTIWRSTGLQIEYYVSVCARLSSVSGSTQTYSRWGK